MENSYHFFDNARVLKIAYKKSYYIFIWTHEKQELQLYNTDHKNLIHEEPIYREGDSLLFNLNSHEHIHDIHRINIEIKLQGKTPTDFEFLMLKNRSAKTLPEFQITYQNSVIHYIDKTK